MHRDPHPSTPTRPRVLAQRGTTLRCKGWKQETILRMLENNLENGERPEDLVIYMSAAKAARNWEAFDNIVATLKDLGNDETLVVHGPEAQLAQLPQAEVLARQGGRWLLRGLAADSLPAGLIAQRATLEDLFEVLT